MIHLGTPPGLMPKSIRRRVGLVVMAMLLALLPAGPAWAAPTVVLDSLTPTSASTTTPVSARLRVHTVGGCLTVQQLGVAVRDSAGNNLDFPGARGTTTICGNTLTMTTSPRTFAPGTYTEFGYYRTSSGYHNLPSRRLVITGPGPSSPAYGKSLAFDEEFDGPIPFGSRWNGSTTSAYKYGNHNPDDRKLDWLNPSTITVSGGLSTFTATPGSHILEDNLRSWDTGLLTTENTTQNFRTRTGDYAEARVQLPRASGSWPAVWTWLNGDSEVDGFEYHPDNPNLLEIANHVHPAATYYTDAANIYPGAWVTLGVHFGATNDDWYLNGRLIFSDHTGVGSTWSPNIILNLSISDGTYHPGPSSASPIIFYADYVRVWR
ncbi:hypothetical protein GCM10010339_34910 [Streptomyces alanosinicus]|uniref:GH16 domain-containing protein n=1 Tax=Streptomyces alanosinicus TaxID=68171 RepID=A0A919D1W0_9ACTN|nr:hypothetical protein GCM10010339_34910 [Streptomyces alanosinicus]